MHAKNFIIAGICAVLAIVFASHLVRRHVVESLKSKERQLRSDLATMRSALKNFEKRHHAKPRALTELVRDGDLKWIPIDPVAGSASTWRTTLEETVRIDDFSATAPASTAPQIIDVHSGATGVDSTGRPWSDY
jgi:general secretion pathway protein G